MDPEVFQRLEAAPESGLDAWQLFIVRALIKRQEWVKHSRHCPKHEVEKVSGMRKIALPISVNMLATTRNVHINSKG